MQFSVFLNSLGSERELRKWDAELLHNDLHQTGSIEKDPLTKTVAKWKGVLLNDVISKALETLPPDLKAQVDLIILKNDQGSQAMFPRSLVTKYPLLLATRRNNEELHSSQVVVPWTSSPKILNEDLPLESFFISNLTRIELANYREKYTLFFLKRRTDPSAMRGEKIFVQNCTACHAAGRGPSISEIPNDIRVRTLASAGHPPVAGNPKLTGRDFKALINYLDAYRAQSSYKQ